MLSRIRHKGLKLLHWVLFANCPLTLEELRFAIAIEEGMTDLDPKRQLPFASFIDWALGLLILDSEENTVRFAHLTIKDYLRDNVSFYFSDGHSLLARTCLTYLSFTALSSDRGRTRFQEDGDLFPFFSYATYQWGHHARKAEKDTKTCAMTIKFLLCERFRHLHDLRSAYRKHSALSLPLHEACYLICYPLR
jgi:hypothetical protein